MELHTKEVGSTPKRHSRHMSYNRASLTRRTTKGPLEVDDPLSASLPTTPIREVPDAVNPALPSSPSSTNPLLPRASISAFEEPAKDFSYLLRPEIYHPLPSNDICEPYLISSNGPGPATTLPKLLAAGHFRSAATVAAALLTGSPSPTAPADIFSLIYVRLACLTLIGATHIAAQEVKALEDLNSPFYRHSITNVHLVPWELQVLAVRLQGIGYGDARRSIMGYYDLARDVRTELGKTKNKADKEIYKERLRDLGIRVANALVEMGDMAAAGRHLESLLLADKFMEEDQLIRGRLALLYLKMGNLGDAKRCIAESTASSTSNPYATELSPLLSMAEGDYTSAATQLTALKEGTATSPDPVVLQNLAVCLIYTGKLIEARPILEALVSDGHSFHTLIFNLSTIYELCSDKSRGLKMELAGKLADRPGSGLGWEKSNMDFKLSSLPGQVR